MTPAQDQMAAIRVSFFGECEELLEHLQDGLTAMQADGEDKEQINVVFRAVHSIKGGAGAFGLNALVAYAHRFETVMDAVRSGRLRVSAEAMRLFYHAADILADQVHAANHDAPEPTGADAALRALEALIPGGPTTVAAADDVPDFQPLALSLSLDLSVSLDLQDAGWQIGFRPLRALYASGNEPLMLLRALSALGAAQITCDLSALPSLAALVPEDAYLGWTISLPVTVAEAAIREVFDFVEDVAMITIIRGQGDVAVPVQSATDAYGADNPDLHSAPVLGAAATASPNKSAPVAPAPPADASGTTVRVELDRVERLVDLVGELVITQAMLAQRLTEAGLSADTSVMSALETFMMLTHDIQDSVMKIRAQPVKPLFQRMSRIVREAALAVEKNVCLRFEGEGTEVDKTVVERLADPLTHMIRNAVDHGIESPSDRLAAGKPTEGVITLSALHRSGRVLIYITDDGAGIDRQRVQQIAAQKGLIAADAQLTDAEIDNLLFLPGFSTAATVSSLSGRGVGMDVVKRAIQGLGGRIAITSERGKGTKISISLPLTLAVLDGMIVTAAGETLVVPISAIVETATLAPDDIRVVAPGSHVMHVRGEFVPLFDLGPELGFSRKDASPTQRIVLVTTTDEGRRAALIVDGVLEQRQVVIKGLHRHYGNIPGIAAATILGDGRIALILDPADLVAQAAARSRPDAFARIG